MTVGVRCLGIGRLLLTTASALPFHGATPTASLGVVGVIAEVDDRAIRSDHAGPRQSPTNRFKQRKGMNVDRPIFTVSIWPALISS